MNEENVIRTETPKRKRNKRQSETPLRTKLLTLQLICGAVIILILFFISRTGGSVSKNISDFYSEIKKNDMAVTEMFGTLKNAAKETFAPSNGAQNQGEDETSSPDISLYEL